MNFSTASKVVDTLRSLDSVERIRSLNRSAINAAANGSPPLTAEEAKKWNLHVNVEWGEMATLFAQARRQYTNGFMRPGNFFRVSIPSAPDEHKTQWGYFITSFINGEMKKSRPYFWLKQNQFAALVAHGIAPQIWCDSDRWRPDFVAIEDLRVPTDTEVSMENLGWFGERHLYTPGELARKVFGPNSDPAWVKPLVQDVLKEYHNLNWETSNYTWTDSPEKMAELYKQNGGYYSSDAVPTIPLWHFYFLDDSNPRDQKWKLRVVPDMGVRGGIANKFLYDAGDKACASELSHILHVNFGDLNNKTPFLWHSIRSLGFLLMEPCYWTNLARCRTLQHLFESFNVWLRVNDPAGRARAQKLELFDKAIIPEGVSVVPQAERHQVDPQMIEMVMAQLRQLMQEASASYTQQIDTGTRKEQTAYETSVKLSMVNAMMSGLLLVAYYQETFAYREICRRFCLSRSTDPDVQRFQKEARRLGIPRSYLNVQYWEVAPEIPLGSGNPAMEMSQATQLMQQRDKYGPHAQEIILHKYTAAITGNYQDADELAPLDETPKVSDAARDAEFAFGTLMWGGPVRLKDGNPIEAIEVFLGLMAGVIGRIEKQTNLATPGELAGLQNVAAKVNELIQQLAQNQEEGPRAKSYAQALGKLMNAVKGFAQRMAEQQQQGNGHDPAALAKVAGLVVGAQAKAQISKAQASQKLEHKEIAFHREQKRKDAQTISEIGRQEAKAKAERRYAAYSGDDN